MQTRLQLFGGRLEVFVPQGFSSECQGEGSGCENHLHSVFYPDGNVIRFGVYGQKNYWTKDAALKELTRPSDDCDTYSGYYRDCFTKVSYEQRFVAGKPATVFIACGRIDNSLFPDKVYSVFTNIYVTDAILSVEVFGNDVEKMKSLISSFTVTSGQSLMQIAVILGIEAGLPDRVALWEEEMLRLLKKNACNAPEK